MTVLLGLDLSTRAAAAVAVPTDWDMQWKRVASLVVGAPLRRDASDAERAARAETIARRLVAFAQSHGHRGMDRVVRVRVPLARGSERPTRPTPSARSISSWLSWGRFACARRRLDTLTGPQLLDVIDEHAEKVLIC